MAMNGTARILVLGYNAWDVSFPVTEMAARNEKSEVTGIRFGGGGPGATAAVALARLGAQVKLVTVLADDWPARWQQEELAAAGIDLDACPRVRNAASPKAVIIVHPDSGARTIYWSRGDLPLMEPGEVRAEWLADRDLFYTDGHETRAAAVLAAEAVRRRLPVVMDAGSVRQGSAELVGVVTDLISSEGFAPRLTGCEAPDAALRALRDRGPQRVAMTFGAGGVLAVVGHEIVHVPAFAVPVVDTTGAGDAFHAGYAFARTQGQGFVDCLEFGSAVAALKCTAWGGREGLPDLATTENLICEGTRVPIPPNLIPLVG